MDHLGQLAEFAASVRFENLPADVVARAKTLLVDTMAAGLAGMRAPGIRPLVEQAQDWGGAPESSIIGYPGKYPAPNAAFVNGAIAHALDYDDTHDDAHTHVNVCVVPSLLAMAESKQVSGRDLLVAYVVAIELVSRLARRGRPHMHEGWLPTTIFGVFGAAAAAGRLLGLRPAAMRHAMGLAYSHAGGNRQGLLDGALSKRIQPGMYARAGLVSADMAARGITGARNALEGDYGLYPMFVGNYQLDALSAGLGEHYELMNIGLKPYPCCRSTHRSIDATLRMLAQADVPADQVESVAVTMFSKLEYEHVGRELVLGENPQVNAQFSVQYTVANALLRKRVIIQDFSEASVRDPQVLNLARRVKVHLDPAATEVTVAVQLAAGRRLVQAVAYPPGHARHFMSDRQVRDKVADCCSHAGMSGPDADALIAAAQGIESLDDVAPFIGGLGKVEA